jgi:ATP-dependent Clp protease ATP-binding subunit ClpA
MEREYERVERVLMDELKQVFRPEFLNRVDEIIVFHALTREQLRAIVGLLVEKVRRQVTAQGMALEVSAEAEDLIADAGYDTQFGARPLKRAIQRLLENPLSRELLRGTFSEGDTIRVTVAGGALAFGS